VCPYWQSVLGHVQDLFVTCVSCVENACATSGIGAVVSMSYDGMEILHTLTLPKDRGSAPHNIKASQFISHNSRPSSILQRGRVSRQGNTLLLTWHSMPFMNVAVKVPFLTLPCNRESMIYMLR